MAKNKKYEATNPNKKKNKKQVVTCPHCGSDKMTYVPDKRRVFPKWYITAGSAVAVVIFLFAAPAFAVAFAVIYAVVAMRKHKVLVGTCGNCGEETLFNRPIDGSLEPDFDQPWIS